MKLSNLFWSVVGFLCLWSLVWVPQAAANTAITTVGPNGLAGQTIVAAPPGGTVVIYTVELTFVPPPGLVRLQQIQIRISDLGAPLGPTGLVQADFTQLRLIESANAVFGDGDDVLLDTVLPGAINVAGGLTTVADLGGIAANLNAVGSRYYFIAADMAAGAGNGHAFRLGADINHIQYETPGFLNIGAAIAADNNNRVVINGLLAAGSTGNIHQIHPIPIPIGYEWVAGLGFFGYATYYLLLRRRGKTHT